MVLATAVIEAFEAGEFELWAVQTTVILLVAPVYTVADQLSSRSRPPIGAPG